MSTLNYRSGLLFLVMPLLAVGLLTACVPPPDNPETREMGAFGIAVETHWETEGWLGGIPQWVHFVRWNGGDDVLKQTEVITSNFQSGSRAYFLNAKPGRYSAIATTEISSRPASGDAVVLTPRKGRGRVIAASWGGGGAEYLAKRDDDGPGALEYFMLTTYFSEELIRKTMVEVQPGAVAFMGKFVVMRDRAITKGDRAQKHFQPLENPKLLDYMGVEIIPSSFTASRSIGMRISRDKQSESEFLASALRDLGGTGWESAVRRGMQAPRSN